MGQRKCRWCRRRATVAPYRRFCSEECKVEARRDFHRRKIARRRRTDPAFRAWLLQLARTQYHTDPACRQRQLQAGREAGARAKALRGPRRGRCRYCRTEFAAGSRRIVCDACTRQRLAVKYRLNQERRRKLDPAPDLTARQWMAIVAAYEMRCGYCQRVMQHRNGDQQHRPEYLTMEHITPMASGGQTTRTNVLPACWGCNGRRGVKSLSDFLGSGARASATRRRHKKILRAMDVGSL